MHDGYITIIKCQEVHYPQTMHSRHVNIIPRLQTQSGHCGINSFITTNVGTFCDL